MSTLSEANALNELQSLSVLFSVPSLVFIPAEGRKPILTLQPEATEICKAPI